MVKPTIHMNGTSPEALLRNWNTLANNLRATIKAAEDCFPNARDYYLQEGPAFSRAGSEFTKEIFDPLLAACKLTSDMQDYLYNEVVKRMKS